MLWTTASLSCWGTFHWHHFDIVEDDDDNDESKRQPREMDLGGSSTGVTAFSTGYNSICAARDRSLYCWGERRHGQVGRGEVYGRQTTALLVTETLTTSTVAIGETHTCALKNGEVYCWGNNDNGRLGRGNGTLTEEERKKPEKVLLNGNPLENIIDLAGGRHHTCALSSDKTVYCWGLGTGGQLGNGANSSQSSAVLVSDIDNGFKNCFWP